MNMAVYRDGKSPKKCYFMTFIPEYEQEKEEHHKYFTSLKLKEKHE